MSATQATSKSASGADTIKLQEALDTDTFLLPPSVLDGEHDTTLELKDSRTVLPHPVAVPRDTFHIDPSTDEFIDQPANQPFTSSEPHKTYPLTLPGYITAINAHTGDIRLTLRNETIMVEELSLTEPPIRFGSDEVEDRYIRMYARTTSPLPGTGMVSLTPRGSFGVGRRGGEGIRREVKEFEEMIEGVEVKCVEDVKRMEGDELIGSIEGVEVKCVEDVEGDKDGEVVKSVEVKTEPDEEAPNVDSTPSIDIHRHPSFSSLKSYLSPTNPQEPFEPTHLTIPLAIDIRVAHSRLPADDPAVWDKVSTTLKAHLLNMFWKCESGTRILFSEKEFRRMYEECRKWREWQGVEEGEIVEEERGRTRRRPLDVVEEMEMLCEEMEGEESGSPKWKPIRIPQFLGSKTYRRPSAHSQRTSDISPCSTYRQDSPSKRPKTGHTSPFDGLIQTKPSIFGNDHCLCIFCKGHSKKFPPPMWGSTYASIRYQNGEFCYCVFCKGCREFFGGPVEGRGGGERWRGGFDGWGGGRGGWEGQDLDLAGKVMG
ncbi:hypothetical protein GLAREA_12696 [Glarea lozoyensis ATCC 20868]|uniref:Uncharacterized protein n=1 Tax=Glarea lozoyensis (strain ATCC 20868 / MF5171) TaxID=1116229 RepID=S3DYG7_GLAL2|nr:uncharacterized protein GLAREA_12696 [Glarea lozoyensis ATCC 20868]EPE31393.1 hypothetical protein GLAREA_12696 [Glarea lozoyensis ATCC 20868]